jgi:hypothetical protein
MDFDSSFVRNKAMSKAFHVILPPMHIQTIIILNREAMNSFQKLHLLGSVMKQYLIGNSMLGNILQQSTKNSVFSIPFLHFMHISFPFKMYLTQITFGQIHPQLWQRLVLLVYLDYRLGNVDHKEHFFNMFASSTNYHKRAVDFIYL